MTAQAAAPSQGVPPPCPPTTASALRAARGPAIGLAIVAGLWCWRGRPVLGALAVALAFAWLQAAVVCPAAVHRVASSAERLAHGVAVVLTVVALGATWLVVVVPVALLNRVLRLDLLDHGAGGRWQHAGGRTSPRHLYRCEARPSGAVGRRTLRLAVVVVALGGAAVAVFDHATRVPPPPVTPFGERAGAGADPSASDVPHDRWATSNGDPVSRSSFPGEPWGAEVLRVQEGPAPCDAYRARAEDDDVTHHLATRYVNVVGGRRRTLTVDDPEHTVWLFGGSTTYGIGQRDEGTIASHLVRLAAARGVRLRVLNLGCPGKVNWTETLEFEAMLRAGMGPPDVAVFLDGVNEWGTAFSREVFGLLDPTVPFVGYATFDEQARLLAEAQARNYVEAHHQRRQARLAAAQYRRGVERARSLAVAYGAPVVHFWQPALFTMPTTAPGNRTVFANEQVDPASALVSGRHYREAAARSGVDPVDLTDIFDDAPRPLFFDCCHTNEAGARLEAAAMYPYVADALAGPRP